METHVRDDKLAKLAEHGNTIVSDLGGNGVLPSSCMKCNGKLDFTKDNNKTVLKCRDCDEIVALD